MSDPQQPDDPWARWRKPAGQEAAVDRPKKEKSAAPARAGNRQDRPAAPDAVAPAPLADLPPVAAEAPEAAPKPSGTLGVRKPPAGVESKPKKRPLRGGALVRKPFERAAVDVKKPEKPSSTARSAKAPAARPAAMRPAAPAASVAAGSEPSGIRLSKVMSERGLCSRREADLWIERGWVFVDGVQISELGSRIDPAAQIEISTEAKKDQAKAVTILLHKPVGYVSGQPEPGCTPAVTLITAEAQLPQPGDPEFKPWMLRGLAPAGRLDVDSTGLLVLTSDGRVAKRLIGEDSDAEKEYLVRVSGQMIKGGLELLRHGLELDGKALKPAWVKQLNEDQLHFILKEGKKRQIRRMCELVGLKVTGLKRVRIGRIRLGDLPMGQWRFLRADEAF